MSPPDPSPLFYRQLVTSNVGIPEMLSWTNVAPSANIPTSSGASGRVAELYHIYTAHDAASSSHSMNMNPHHSVLLAMSMPVGGELLHDRNNSAPTEQHSSSIRHG